MCRSVSFLLNLFLQNYGSDAKWVTSASMLFLTVAYSTLIISKPALWCSLNHLLTLYMHRLFGGRLVILYFVQET